MRSPPLQLLRPGPITTKRNPALTAATFTNSKRREHHDVFTFTQNDNQQQSKQRANDANSSNKRFLTASTHGKQQRRLRVQAFC
ncbi:hypothetical protein KY285_005645 [Solanum tuberosum]|nr:hypothetical protein KY285_005645 [Solanum tuberosum]